MGGRTGDDFMIMPFLIRQTGLFFKISLFFFVVLLGRRYSHLVLVEKRNTTRTLASGTKAYGMAFAIAGFCSD